MSASLGEEMNGSHLSRQLLRGLWSGRKITGLTLQYLTWVLSFDILLSGTGSVCFYKKSVRSLVLGKRVLVPAGRTMML